MRVRTSAKQEQEPDSQESALASGTSSLVAFASFSPDSCSSKTSPDLPPRWVPVQENLLSQASSLTWPKEGTWDLSFVYRLPRLERLTSESESSSLPDLLPTPNAYESTPTAEYVSEVREHMQDPYQRLYLPGRKWHAQRTLSRVVPALLPTPGANDSTGGEGPTRVTRQETGRTGGASLRDIDHLLPTPTSSYRGDRSETSKEKGGGQELRAIRKLLPTPTTQDAHNTEGESQRRRRSDSLAVASTKLSLSGESTSQPSDAGKVSSDVPHQSQLTIEED
jgi:hypothetical protein